MAVINGAVASETPAGIGTPPAGRTWSISTFLFHTLGVAAVSRVAHVPVVGKGVSVDIAVDADGSAGNAREVTVGHCGGRGRHCKPTGI
jgi:hypothetical protein